MSERTIKTPFSDPITPMGHVPQPVDPFMEQYRKEDDARMEQRRNSMDNDDFRKMENNHRHHSYRNS